MSASSRGSDPGRRAAREASAGAGNVGRAPRLGPALRFVGQGCRLIAS